MTHSSFSADLPVIDQILNKNGYSFRTWLFILAAFFITYINGAVLVIFSFMIIPLREYFEMNDTEIQIISSLIYFGLGTASFFTGKVTKLLERENVIKFTIFIIILCNILCSYTKSLIVFGFLRVLIGLNLGLTIPLVFNILSEHLPMYYRAFTLTSVWTGQVFGHLTVNVIMLILLPDLRPNNVPYAFLTLALIIGIIYLFMIFTIQDSPRNLIINGRYERAFHILESLHKSKLDKPTRHRILHEVKSVSSELKKGEISDLFSKHFWRTTVLLIFTVFITSNNLNGPPLISSLVLKTIQGQTESNTEVIKKQIYIALIIIPSNFIGGILSETPSLGRNKAKMLGFFLTGVFFILCTLIKGAFYPFYALAMLNIYYAQHINYPYVSEVYSTKLRDTAFGFIFTFQRVGSITSQYLYIVLFNISAFLPFYISAAFAVISLILTLFLPYETYNQPLDKKYEHKEVSKDDEEKKILLED